MAFLKYTQRLPLIIVAFTLAATLLTACKKESAQPVQLSGLSFINASPSAAKFNFFIASDRVNDVALSYTAKIDYVNVYPGDVNFTLKNSEDASTVATQTFKLDPQVGYSLFAAGQSTDVKFLLLKDDLTKPATGKARIRFVNLSPDGPAFNLAIAGKTTDLFTNKQFKEYTTFEDIDAADGLTFNLKNTATSATVVTITDVQIEAGKIYTIYAKGLYTALTGTTPISLSVFTHK